MTYRAARNLGPFLLHLILPLPLAADGGVTFQDVAAGGGAGVTYRRTPSASNAIFDAIKLDPPYNQEKRLATPQKPRGAPGVAILDYDGDGDLDLYVTNGPGTANSLYSNQLVETGETTFVDVAAAAGVEASDQDSTGVCFGDLDNDGDPDLLVLSHNSPDRLFENRGGVFADVTAASGIAAGGVRASSGCSMGDVDGDGLLDVVIGNTYDNWDHYRGIFEPFALNQHNQLFLNAGGNVFVDVSAASGIEDLAGFPPGVEGAAGLTWAVALVDVDLDGDVDLLTADDQGSVPTAEQLGLDRGLLHLFRNDGTGRFTDVSPQAGLAVPGSWMGFAIGDYDCDGHLDFFASDFGDYVPLVILEPGRSPSRWFLGSGEGTYRVPGVGHLITTPFGWGASPFDYDNDGDLDVIYHGGIDAGPGIEASNTGVLLANPGCSALFDYDAAALAGSTDHGRRTVHGVAVGDLDANGFVDVVSVSNFDIPGDVELRPYPPTGSPFDERARFHLSFEVPPGGTGFEWVGSTFDDGTLAVELSSGGNGNGWVEVRTVGAVGLTSGGRVNRDGIGAVVRFWSDARPEPGTMLPIVGGSSYASQDALAAHFGLGSAAGGTVEVLWPGGVRNRLYDVRSGERVVFPEIPCSIDDEALTLRGYLACLLNNLDELVDAGVIGAGERARFLVSAVRARRDSGQRACAVDGEFKRLDLLTPLLSARAQEGGVTFTDVAAGDGAGIAYRRAPSESKAKFDAIKLDPPYTSAKHDDTPVKPWGAPGVALFDHDGDGDLDVYVTNGPGAANSLYSNQLVETGATTFVDVGEAAGVGAADQDSTGVCFGDLDNDGDHDLLVLSHNSPHRLFENRGDGTFDDVSAASGVGALEVRSAMGCSMGDVDGDGLLDVVIANAYGDLSHSGGLNVERYALNQHNQLLLNAGGNVFVDAGAASGLEDLAGYPPEAAGAAGLTWAVAMADYDLDGDVDVFSADDQSGFPPAADGGVDRGLLHVFANDGAGRLADVSLDVFGATRPGAWMGFSFGDYNCDGVMDFFATNFGDYAPGFPARPGFRPSRWFLGRRAEGAAVTFSDPGVGDLVTTPFGWGTSTADYDNDGDLDVIYHGGMDIGLGIDVANPGVVLRNPGCSAEFVYDPAPLAGSTHLRRNVQGMAVGDLDADGFLDVVSVSNFNIPADVKLTQHLPAGSPFDATAFYHLNFEPDANGFLVWVGSTFEPGTLAVELSSGGNGNRWADVRTLGTVGITSAGRANRDGIGAVVQLRQEKTPGPGVMLPVLGGSSYASQDSLTAHFGLGAAERAIVDVYWPGGVRNRLYNVKAGERVVFPEIPCSFADVETSLGDHLTCLLDAFDELVDAGALRRGERVRYLMSAVRARRAAQGVSCADDESALLDAFSAELEGAEP